MVQECSLWAIRLRQIVEFADSRCAPVLVVSLDDVCGEKAKNDIRRPGTVDKAFTNRCAVDANMVDVAYGSSRQFGCFILIIAGGLKQGGSDRIEPAIKRFF